jgi:hypothetical protein
MASGLDKTVAASEFVALDFVYCGRRWSKSSGSMMLCVRAIKDGVLQDAGLYAFDRKAHRAIGGVYSGAVFSEEGIRNLSGDLVYQRRWDVREDLIDWQARDEAAESASRSKKLEADAKKISEIEKIMLPLRVQYENYRKKRDHAGMEALRAAVVNALASSPRSTEL